MFPADTMACTACSLFYIDHIGKRTTWVHPSAQRTARRPKRVAQKAGGRGSQTTRSGSEDGDNAQNSLPAPIYDRATLRKAGHTPSRGALSNETFRLDVVVANRSAQPRGHTREMSKDDFAINVSAMTLRKAGQLRVIPEAWNTTNSEPQPASVPEPPTRTRDVTRTGSTPLSAPPTSKQKRSHFKRLESRDDIGLRHSSMPAKVDVDDGRDTVRGRSRKRTEMPPNTPPMSVNPYGSTNLKRLLADFSV
jgi:hypothetical protein